MGAALISGGLNLAGGIFGSLGAQSANAANLAFANQQMQAQQRQFDEQMQFARDQLGWNENYAVNKTYYTVQDAIRAGVSPLVALGAPSFTPNSISVGGTIGGNSAMQTNPYAGAGESLGRAGQDISRAIMATKTVEEKEMARQLYANAVKDGREKDAHASALEAQANYYNAKAAEVPAMQGVGGTPGRVRGQAQSVVVTGPDESDKAYRTNNGTLEYQPAPGTPASQGDFLNSVINWGRNRLGVSSGTGPSPGRILKDIQALFPGAVDFKKTSAGYAPVYPDEEVRNDVRREPRQGVPTVFGRPIYR